MDGLTCVKIIREWQNNGELTRPVPVIAVTANARLEQVQKAKDHGMVCRVETLVGTLMKLTSSSLSQDSVVTKPFRISELLPECYNLIAKTSV